MDLSLLTLKGPTEKNSGMVRLGKPSLHTHLSTDPEAMMEYLGDGMQELRLSQNPYLPAAGFQRRFRAIGYCTVLGQGKLSVFSCELACSLLCLPASLAPAARWRSKGLNAEQTL